MHAAPFAGAVVARLSSCHVCLQQWSPSARRDSLLLAHVNACLPSVRSSSPPFLFPVSVGLCSCLFVHICSTVPAPTRLPSPVSVLARSHASIAVQRCRRSLWLRRAFDLSSRNRLFCLAVFAALRCGSHSTALPPWDKSHCQAAAHSCLSRTTGSPLLSFSVRFLLCSPLQDLLSLFASDCAPSAFASAIPTWLAPRSSPSPPLLAAVPFSSMHSAASSRRPRHPWTRCSLPYCCCVLFKAGVVI